MKFFCLTLFPEMIEMCMNTSIVGRAIKNDLLSMEAINIHLINIEEWMTILTEAVQVW